MKLSAITAAATLFASVAARPSERSWQGKQLVQVSIDGEEQYAAFAAMVEEFDLDVWNADAVKGTADVIFDSRLGEGGLFQYTTVIADVQAHFDALYADPAFVCENGVEHCVGSVGAANSTSTRDLNNDPYYDSYQRLDTIYAKMDTIADSSSLVETFSIGKSYENREIRGFKITGSGGFSSSKPKAVYNCGIHAREWLPPAFCIWLVDNAAVQYGSDEAVTAMLDTYEIHVVPILNPDGYEYSHTTSSNWRKSRKPNSGSTAVGTDLNRNFAQGWGGDGSSSNPGSDVYRGEAPLDNVESAAIVAYWEEVQPVVIMDIHAYGNMWLQPYGTEPRSKCFTNPRGCGVPSDDDYNAQTQCGKASVDAIRDFSGLNFSYGPITYVIYQASGGSCDDAYGKRGIKYAYSPEVRGSSFQPPVSNIRPSNNELFLGTLAQLECIASIEGF